MKYIHVCLVSDQPSPTLAPLWDKQLAAEGAVLVISPEQKGGARLAALVGVLKQRGLRIDQIELSTAWDVESVQNTLAEWLDSNSNGSRFLLNATGGTKPMSIGAFNAFYSAGWPVYYVNVTELTWLFHPDKAENLTLNVNLSLEDLLGAHNVQVISINRKSISGDRRNLALRWLRRVRDQGEVLGKLNWLAAVAKQRNMLEFSQEGELVRNPLLNTLLEELSEIGVLELLSGPKVRFASDDARDFANGFWCEGAVFEVLRTLKIQHPELKIGDIAHSVRVDMRDGRAHAEQEIDIAFVARNRLHLIECKTANLSREGDAGSSKGEDAMFKLAALQDKLGGLHARGMIVSYRKIRTEDKERAPLLKLNLIDADRLSDLQGCLMHWLRGNEV